jgi:hypothetical protein
MPFFLSVIPQAGDKHEMRLRNRIQSDIVRRHEVAASRLSFQDACGHVHCVFIAGK